MGSCSAKVSLSRFIESLNREQCDTFYNGVVGQGLRDKLCGFRYDGSSSNGYLNSCDLEASSNLESYFLPGVLPG